MASQELLQQWEETQRSLPADAPQEAKDYYARVVAFMRAGEARPMQAAFAAKRRERELKASAH